MSTPGQVTRPNSRPSSKKKGRTPQLVLGWREWVSLPELGVERIKAKFDSGARTSAIHAFDIEPFERGGEQWVRFLLHPKQRSTRSEVACEARPIDQRAVRSSSGQSEIRWTIVTPLRVAGQTWPIELTLARRDNMGFRLLLGRQAMRSRILLDPAGSFLAGR